jgi:hypothetical protein
MVERPIPNRRDGGSSPSRRAEHNEQQEEYVGKSNYKINKEQREHLHGRILALRWIKDAFPKPAKVKRAEDVLHAWKKAEKEHDAKFRAAWDKKVQAAKQAIAFGDPDAALKAVTALEAEAAKTREYEVECRC